jgi:hypothetical protein
LGSSSSSNKREKTESKFARIANSAMSFIIAYLLVVFLSNLVTGLVGKVFGFDVNVSYSGVKFDIGRHKWDLANIIVVWSIGTVFIGLLGVLFYYLFSQFKSQLYLANLFFLWGAVISFSFVVAQSLLPCIDHGQQLACYINLSVVFAWLSLPLPLVYLICLCFLVFLVFFSINTSKPFLSFSYTFSKVNRSARKRKYFLETVIVPYIVAAAVILLYTRYTYPYVNFYIINVIYLSCIGLSLFVSFLVINISDMKTEEVLRYKNLQTISPVLFIIFTVLLIFLTAANKGFYIPF